MAKETPTLSKDERRALKAAKKEAKASKPEGVTKPEKKDKKEKKDKTVLAERALKEIQNGNATTVKGDEGSEEEEEDGQAEEDNEVKGKKIDGTMTTTARPIGALVPFANPLADEKVAKKVFKGVKKGVCFSLLLRYILSVISLIHARHATIALLAAPPPPIPTSQSPSPFRNLQIQ
jgi:H/ACA ribonucleoprotein complex subunit 2